jgi:hypothetical protein
MTFPSLDHFESTVQSLHKIAMLLGFVRILAYEPLSNYLELGLKVLPEGLSTDRLPGGGEMILDFKQGAVVYHPHTGASQTFPIHGQTQAALFEALLMAVETSELSRSLGVVEGATVIERAINAAHALPRYARRNINEFIETELLTIESQIGADYADALYTIFTVTARFRARLLGSMTPIVVWPEHFDLSTLWFHPDNTAMDSNKAHLNFGFAPYSPGLERPYIYVYAYPYPAQYAAPVLPSPARWHTEGWTGAVLSYDDIVTQANPEQFLETVLESIYHALRPLIGLN